MPIVPLQKPTRLINCLCRAGTLSQTVCDAQLQLCHYGLVLVCLKLINDDSDRTSMMGMQMLSAILDGESEDVRDSTVRQLAVPDEEVGWRPYRSLIIPTHLTHWDLIANLLHCQSSAAICQFL